MSTDKTFSDSGLMAALTDEKDSFVGATRIILLPGASRAAFFAPEFLSCQAWLFRRLADS